MLLLKLMKMILIMQALLLKPGLTIQNTLKQLFMKVNGTNKDPMRLDCRRMMMMIFTSLTTLLVKGIMLMLLSCILLWGLSLFIMRLLGKLLIIFLSYKIRWSSYLWSLHSSCGFYFIWILIFFSLSNFLLDKEIIEFL